LINERCLAVIDVRNDGNITDFIHGRVAFRGEKRGSIAETEEESNLRRSSGTTLGNCSKAAPLWCSVDPFAMLADQILQPLNRFHFGNVEFRRCFADDPSESV